MRKKKTKAQGDIRFGKVQIDEAKNKAAGLDAIKSTIAQVSNNMRTADAIKTMFSVNQKGGFDCPGCAWPDPDDDRSRFGEYCENGIKAIAEEASKRIIGKDFFAGNSVYELSKKSDFELGKFGRLCEPMVLDADEEYYKPISWENAFNLIAEELRGLNSPDEAIFYTSGRTSNEAAFLYQLFVRAFGTNNLPDCSNMCHESSGKGLSQTVGIGKGSVTLNDIYQAEVVLIMGQNPGTNHPRMLTALERCKENGGKIISINPLKEAGLGEFKNPQRPSKLIRKGTPLADLHLPVRINGDIALLKAVMIKLLQEEQNFPGEVIDHNFIINNTSYYDLFIKHISTVNLNDCIKHSGLEETQIDELVELIKFKKKIIVCWAMGLTQHENGVENIREIVNFLLLKGAIGKEGAGTCPVRGHSNVQGDRTMGIWEAPKQAFLDKLDEIFKIKSPRKHGFAVVDAINAMHWGRSSVFIAMGGNFISACPDTEFTAEALRKCSLTVHISTKLNRSHLIHGNRALILPCLGRTEKDIQKGGEQFVSVENSMGIVHSSKGVLSPSSKYLKSEVAIVCGIASAVLDESPYLEWDEYKNNYDHIRDLIEQVIPGFSNYNIRVREKAGFYLPNAARDGRFNTATKKAIFTVNHIPDNRVDSDELIMMTIRSHDQYNTTIYGLDDRYRGITNARRVVLLNQKDMDQRGLVKGALVNLSGTYNNVQRSVSKFMVVPYDIPSGCCATYFPEANPLVPIDSFAKESKTPASKFVRIKVEAI